MKKLYITHILLCFLGVTNIYKGWGQTNPAYFSLSSGSWILNGWYNLAGAGNYPTNNADGTNNSTHWSSSASNYHMIFHWMSSEQNIQFTANGSSDYSCGYNLSTRPRITGQGSDGFSFINTSDSQYNDCSSGSASNKFVGAAVLGLNSTGRTNIQVSWTGRVISATSINRICEVALQYRYHDGVGFTTWTILPSNTYTSGGTVGSFSNFGPTTLPDVCENRAQLQIRWIYYTTGGSGTRPSLAVDNISVTSVACTPTNYYSKSTGDLNSLSTWGINTDGSGSNPTGFNIGCQTFYLRNGNPGVLSGNLTISGSGSKLVVEQTNLTIPSSHAIFGTIDVDAGRTLTIENTQLPKLGTLNSTSKVIYKQGGSFLPVANTYGNVELDNTSLSNPASATDWNVGGSILLKNGATFNASNLGINTFGTNHQTFAGGNFVTRSFDNSLKTNGDLILGNNIQLTIGTPGSGALRGTFTGIGNRFVDNGSTITVGNNLRLGGSSNGYDLTGTIILVNNSGTTHITGSEDNNTQIAAHLNNLVSNVSGTATTSFRPITTSGTILIKGNLSITGSGSGTVFLNENILSIGGSFFYERTTNNINSGTTGGLAFYGNGSHLFVSSATSTVAVNNIILNKNGRITQVGNLSVTSLLGILNGVWDAQQHTLSSANAVLSVVGGGLRLAKTGVTLPEFSRTGTDAYTFSNSYLELYGTGSQTLRGARQYATLWFSGNTVANLSSTCTTTGVGVFDNAILDVANNSSFGDANGVGLTMTGNALYRTSGSGTQPSMRDLYFLSPGTTIEFYGSNGSVNLRQGPTTGGTAPHRYQNLLFRETLTITAPANVLRVEGNFTNSLTGGLFRHNNGTVSFTGTNQTIMGITPTLFNNLHAANSGSLRVADSITVQNILSVIGANVLLSTGTRAICLVSSSATGTARLGIVPPTATVTARINMQRFVPAKKEYRFYSSPVQSHGLVGMKNDIFLTNLFGNNGFDNSTYNFPSVYWYAETVVGGMNSGWRTPATVNTHFASGRGYMVHIRGSRADDINAPVNPSITAAGSNVVLNSIGVPHTGTVQLPVTFTPTAFGLTADGWNLVGNPYPCEIDWDSPTGWVKNHLDDAIYLFDPGTANTTLTGVGGKYVTYKNGVASDGSSFRNIIPSSQGFFVKATATGANLTVNENAKVVAPVQLVNFRKDNALQTLVLQLSNGMVTDESLLRLERDATSSFNARYDAHKMMNGINVYFLDDAARPMAIKAHTNKKDTLLLPFVVRAAEGEYSLQSFNQLPNARVYVIDAMQNDTVSLNENAYSFTLSSTENLHTRFRLLIIGNFNNEVATVYTENNNGFYSTDNEVIETTAWQQHENIEWLSSTARFDNRNVVCYPNPTTQNEFVLLVPEKFLHSHYVLKDAMGNTLQSGMINQTGTFRLPAQNIAAGIYYFAVSNPQQKQVLKIQKLK